MDSNLGSAQKAKKKRFDVESPRHLPEGDSITQKKVMKIKKCTPANLTGPRTVQESDSATPKSASKKKKRRSSVREDEADQPEKKAKIEDNSPSKTDKITPKKSKKKQGKAGSLNGSWEKAVQKARGSPDGATEDSFFTVSDPNSPSKSSSDEKGKKTEKKKTMKVRKFDS